MAPSSYSNANTLMVEQNERGEVVLPKKEKLRAQILSRVRQINAEVAQEQQYDPFAAVFKDGGG